LALVTFGAAVARLPGGVEVRGGEPFHGQDLRVPGDISSAAFLAAAAAALDGSMVEITGVGLNPTRRSILTVLERFGARIETIEEGATAGGEPIGSIRAAHGGHQDVVLTPDDVPALIDELPVLAALATHGGELKVTGAAELRIKESDRITGLVTGLRGLGADADELPDGFHIRSHGRLAGGTADARGDHRLAMAFAVAALGADKPSVITGADSVAVSYPGFFEVLESLCE
jgi:3-phosphoshikimate 1-carboxyvinyltransferase